ncbi:MAG: putative sulfate exporter family transporter [Pseudomonadales bacterium]|nr:putative sulfate exporter family transporter [Pseudomonadales bacterium]
MIRQSYELVRNSALPLMPGLLISLTIVFAAHYISAQYGSPLVLTTVLLGMAFNNLSRYDEFRPGLEYSAKVVLRCGVALMGIRITFEQIGVYGLEPIILVAICVCSTILFSVLVGKWIGADRFTALLTGVATGICGVSAAMAFLALQSGKRAGDTQVACTLVAVTCISTMAMILYPALLSHLDLPAATAGMFLGTTVHDVAQAIGAGEMLSPEVADATIYTKMLRVSLLVPVLFTLSAFCQPTDGAAKTIVHRLPLFLLVFMIIVLLNNLISIPPVVQQSMSSISQFCLVMAMAALGVRTNLLDLFTIEKRSLSLVLLNTGFIVLISTLMLSF